MTGRGLRMGMTAGVVLAMVSTGCNKKKDDTGNLKTAINSYYDQFPECLWKQPVQLPQQIDKDDASKVRPYDALVDQGLLARTPLEKTKLLILKKEANSYDLTDKGRGDWTADPTQPGYGNFCFAHRKVKDIISNTPAGTQPGATTTVNYTYTLGDVKSWAQAPETQTAFPALASALAATNSAQTTLVLTNDGWRVPPNKTAARAATGDSGVVQ